MASAKKPKPITRAELEGLSHKDLAKVETKRRILASLPEETPAPAKPKREGTDEKFSPTQRMQRGHEQRDAARAARGGGGDGDE